MAAKTTKKPSPKKPTTTKQAEKTTSRVRKAPYYKSFRLQKKLKHPKGQPPQVRRLLEKSFSLLWAVKKPLLGIIIVFAILNLLFVRGLQAPVSINELRGSIEESLGGETDNLSTNLAVFSELINGSDETTAPESASIYSSLFVLLLSLALVWLFRQHTAGNKPSTKLAFYRSTYPLVPTVLVILVIGLQLLPFAVVSSLFSIVMNNGIAANGFEVAVWMLLLFSSGILSLYLVSSSVFALYIVTLPDMTPMKALRSARQLVLHRRFVIMRRLIVAPIIMFVILAGLLLPAIFFAGIIAPWVYFGLSLLALPFLHSYVYSLYRELL